MGPAIYRCTKSEVPCGCGRLSVVLSNARMIHGEEAVTNSWSMVVSIRLSSSDRHACGGTILSESHVLTAASCVADRAISSISIAAGVHNRSDSYAIIRKVDSMFIHPDYVRTADDHVNNVAILHLSQPLDFKSEPVIARTCLPEPIPTVSEPIFYPSPGTLLAVVGWGYTHPENTTDPDMLQQAKVYAMQQSEASCPILPQHRNTQFCAGASTGANGGESSFSNGVI